MGFDREMDEPMNGSEGDSKAARETEMSMVYADAQAENEQLQSVVNVLEKRLQHVLRPEEPADNNIQKDPSISDAAEKLRVSRYASHLAQRHSSNNDVIRANRKRLQKIIDRLEV